MEHSKFQICIPPLMPVLRSCVSGTPGGHVEVLIAGVMESLLLRGARDSNTGQDG
jgi:hypothetical protein